MHNVQTDNMQFTKKKKKKQYTLFIECLKMLKFYVDPYGNDSIVAQIGNLSIMTWCSILLVNTLPQSLVLHYDLTL